MSTFKTIATHVRPHLDEIVGIWMLVKFGEGVFPGINEALVEFWDKMPEGKTVAQLETEGVVCVGIGGGRFDEHPSASNGRKQDDCALTLIAKELNFLDDPAVQPLLKFVRTRDLKLTGSSFDLHGLIKTLYTTNRDDMTVWKWAFEIIEAIYEQNLGFFEGAATDFLRAKIHDIIVNNKKTKLVAGISDSREFAKYARSPHGCRAGVVIQQNSAGNVQIQTRSDLGINLVDTVRIIRIEEIKAAGGAVPKDWKSLETEGTIYECDRWHFFPEGRMLLNGSTTAGKPPTKLKLNRIEELVQIGIGRSFEPSKASRCQQGNCTSHPWDPCAWYSFGLQRCRKIRFDAAQRQPNQQRNSTTASQ